MESGSRIGISASGICSGYAFSGNLFHLRAYKSVVKLNRISIVRIWARLAVLGVMGLLGCIS
jgi:hypothetical protein